MKKNLNRLTIILPAMLVASALNADPYICLSLGGGCLMRSVTSPLYYCQGESVDLYARGSGILIQNPPCDNPGYQWRHWIDVGGFLTPVTLYGETNNVLTVTATGIYDCLVSCSGGGYTTSAATIYFSDPQTSLSVTSNPEDRSPCLGDYVTFSAAGSGGYVKYQWQELEPEGSWSNIGGENSKDLTFVPELGDNLDRYKCVISNGCKTAESQSALLIVMDSTEITLDPANDSVCESTAAGFSINADGNNLTYLWQERPSGSGSWQSLSSSGNYEFDQSGNLTIKNSGAGMTGYSYRAIVNGACAPQADTSLPAELFIKSPPLITEQPGNDTACVGGDAHFSVEVSGTEPFSFKWQKGGKTVRDWGSEAFLDLSDLGLDDNQDVQVLVSDQCFGTGNPVSSDLAGLVVNPLPLVSLGEDRRICSGSTTMLDPGGGYESYAWSSGDSTRSIEVGEQGSYTVRVTDAGGCSDEDNVYIIVDPPVAEVDLGGDSAFCLGEEVTLDAGPGYDWYEWSDGSTGQSVEVAGTGSYWVKAGNNNTVCEAADTVHITISEPYDKAGLCLVTVDPSTGRFIVVWERTPDVGIQQYNIYREGVWIGSVAYDDLSIFKDMEADPEKRPYRYEMTVTDTCGNESAFSPYHIPIFLQFSGYIGGVNLSWEKYQVEGATISFDSYTLYRGSDSTQLDLMEENIPAEVSVFVDKDPAALDNNYFYRVAGLLSDPCNPSGGTEKAGTGPYTHSLSNLDDNKLKSSGLESLFSNALNVYPNPADDIATVRFGSPVTGQAILRITDITGQTVRIFRDLSGDGCSFSVSDLAPGYYHLELSGASSAHANFMVR